MNTHSNRNRPGVVRVVTTLLLAAALGAQSLLATTYISAEPIPTADVIGVDALATIESVGYARLERWAARLLDCGTVDSVIQALRANDAITTITKHNTRVVAAAGGFEGVTHPTFVFTVEDRGKRAASASDVDVLDNALGYVLSQGGTTHFSPDNPDAYDFPLDYAVVTFKGQLEGIEAKGFFDYLGTIDPALWSGPFAGFTQIDFEQSPKNDAMLFLQPDVSTRRFVDGLSLAARTTQGATYVTRTENGRPTTAQAGVAFPGNDWLAFPNGDQYLSHLPGASPPLLMRLAVLRQRHLDAVADLVAAIEAGHVDTFLGHQFTCSGQ